MLHQIASSLRRSVGTWHLINRLAVRQHARFDARQSPPLAAGTPTQTERAIATRYETRRQTLERARARAFRAERVEVIAAQLSGEPHSCTTVVANTRAHLLRDLVAVEPGLRAAQQRIADRQQDLRDFQNDNLLARAPNTPNAWRSILTIAAIVAVESVVNSLFFRNIADGDLDSTSTAAALCIPTLAVGLVAGYFGRRGLNHVQAWVRQVGSLVLVAAALFAVVWLLCVGHVRLAAGDASAGGDLGHAVAGVFAKFREDPLSPLYNPQALALMAVSALALLVAVWHGYRGLADPYPGYSHVDRQLRDATADAHDVKRRYYRTVDRRIATALRNLARHRRAIDRAATDALLIIERMRHTSIGFDQRAADVHAIHSQALALYHELMTRLRPDGPPLRAASPGLTPAGLPPLEFQAAKDNIAAARDTAQTAAIQAAATIEALRTEIMTRLEGQRMPSLSTPAPSLTAPYAQAAE